MLPALLRQAEVALASKQFQKSQEVLAQARSAFPKDTEVLRLSGISCLMSGASMRGVRYLRRAQICSPDSAVVQMSLGSALFQTGRIDEGLGCLERACELSPSNPEAWFNAGTALAYLAFQKKQLRALPQARRALLEAVKLAPTHISARNKLARVLISLGEIENAVQNLRETLRRAPGSIEAWALLGGLKVEPLNQNDLRHLQLLERQKDLSIEQRSAIQITLGKALEDLKQYAAAYDMFAKANTALHERHQWDRASEQRRIEQIAHAFAEPVESCSHSDLGSDIVFIVCVPRSGSSLVEQILASHSAVQGGGETRLLVEVLQAESDRRGTLFPHWVAESSQEDWRRMGQEYLSRVAPLREDRLQFTDKSIDNWAYVGAIRKMLPGARVVDSRRDAVETCFACYRQLFSAGGEFSNNLSDMASYYAGYIRLTEQWQRQNPRTYFVNHYEKLQADHELQISRLLNFCGLPFEASCLSFHENKRAVLTMSSGQVRQSISNTTARASRYGALLDPLRKALADEGVCSQD